MPQHVTSYKRIKQNHQLLTTNKQQQSLYPKLLVSAT